MYLATFTRPNLTFAVGLLSRFVNQPSKSRWSGEASIALSIQHFE
uniref:Uncharacterized protein n=1 Tax=Peronospora matthiolae TaxID=2874970 RepID=A0AAV1UUK9_9STRA